MSEEHQTTIPETDAVSAHAAVEEGSGVVLDVREPEELEQVRLQHALHIPLGQLPSRLSEVPRNEDVYVLCHVGQRSAMATQLLRQVGHDRVWNIRGGILGWLQARLPAQWGDRS